MQEYIFTKFNTHIFGKNLTHSTDSSEGVRFFSSEEKLFSLKGRKIFP
jgi:hypothetical protein